MNSENITIETIKGKPVIGLLKNNWRQRHVTIYDHPTNPEMVVSVGVPFNNTEQIVCVEERTAYARVISRYPETVTYD